MTRIVFMGTPDFAVPSLKAVISSGHVVGVVTQPDRPAGRGNKLRQPPVKVAAVEAGIPVFQPESLRKYDAAAPLRAWKPDLIIVAAFGQILRPHVLDLPKLGCVNVHASLLPRWRGASPIQHAILEGDTHTGVTLMQMDVGLDTGDILVKESIEIDSQETAASLHDRLAELGGDMTARYLDDLLAGRLVAIPQDNNLSTYAPMIGKMDGQLDWTQSADALDRRLRAMSPWPGAFTFLNGKQLKIHQAIPRSGAFGQPGQVTLDRDGNAVVAAGEGGLELQKIQLAGKKPLKVAEFLRGRPDFGSANLQSTVD